MYRKTTRAAFAALALGAGVAAAAPPAAITYSGFLTDGAGAPVTGAQQLTFRFYDASVGGNQLGTPQTVGVAPGSDGYFAAVVTPPQSLFESQVYMSVQFVGDAAEMAPRIAITSVPSALAVDWTGVANIPAPCASGQLLRGYDAAGSAVCGDDGNTTYAAGTGLSLAGTTFSADTSYLQRRVGSCAAGLYLAGVGADGSPICALDANTTYSSGAGLVLAGTAFSADTSYLQRRVSASCPAGQYLTGVGADGTPICTLDANTTYSAGSGLSLAGTTFSASFGGTGAAATVARSDHTHATYVPYAAGDATVTGRYAFGAAKTGYLNISALSFVGDNLVRHTGFGEAYLAPGQSLAFVTAPVHLPQGATITEFRCTLLDNEATGSVGVSLRRNSAFPDDVALASVATTTDSAAAQTLIDNTIVSGTVDNASWAYYLEVRLAGPSNTRTLSINNCRVTYTVTELAP